MFNVGLRFMPAITQEFQKRDKRYVFGQLKVFNATLSVKDCLGKCRKQFSLLMESDTGLARSVGNVGKMP